MCKGSYRVLPNLTHYDRCNLIISLTVSVLFYKLSYSQPLRHEQMGKGIHFIFEVVFSLKFSGEHDPAGRVFEEKKKGSK